MNPPALSPTHSPAFSPALTITYFVVWSALAIGKFVLYRRHPEPAFRIKWHSRLMLLLLVIVMAFMIAIVPPSAIMAIPAFAIVYLQMSKTAICTSCGKVINPIGVLRRAKHCPHCGGETAGSPLWPSEEVR